MSEKKAVYVNGYIGLIGLVLLVGIGGFLFYFGMTSGAIFQTVMGFVCWLIAIALLSSERLLVPTKQKLFCFLDSTLGRYEKVVFS